MGVIIETRRASRAINTQAGPVYRYENRCSMSDVMGDGNEKAWGSLKRFERTQESLVARHGGSCLVCQTYGGAGKARGLQPVYRQTTDLPVFYDCDSTAKLGELAGFLVQNSSGGYAAYVPGVVMAVGRWALVTRAQAVYAALVRYFARPALGEGRLVERLPDLLGIRGDEAAPGVARVLRDAYLRCPEVAARAPGYELPPPIEGLFTALLGAGWEYPAEGEVAS